MKQKALSKASKGARPSFDDHIEFQLYKSDEEPVPPLLVQSINKDNLKVLGEQNIDISSIVLSSKDVDGFTTKSYQFSGDKLL